MDNSWVYLEESSTVPPDAVVGGHDVNGHIEYVGRIVHAGLHLPAKVIPHYKAAYMGLDGKEYKILQYEVLTGCNYKWVPAKDKVIPPNAVVGGRIETGVKMFIGREQWRESLTVGRINTIAQAMFVSRDGLEHRVETFEVLTHSLEQDCRKSPCFNRTWVSTSGSCVPENAVLLDQDKCIYIGRAFHKGVLLPALVSPHKACAYVLSAEGRVEKFNFEVLTGGDTYRWEMAEFGNVPPGAVEGSRTDRDEPLYIGRTDHLGYTTIGQVKQSDGCMYITVDGKQVPVRSYEVLVNRDGEKSLRDCGCKSNK